PGVVERAHGGPGEEPRAGGNPRADGASDLPVALRLQPAADDGSPRAHDEAGPGGTLRRRTEGRDSLPALRRPAHDHARGPGRLRGATAREVVWCPTNKVQK